MNPVKPRTPTNPDWKEVTYAEHQEEYNPLPVIRDSMNPTVPVVSVWEPTTDELNILRSMIASGRVFISLRCLTFGHALQPLNLFVGEFGDPYRHNGEHTFADEPEAPPAKVLDFKTFAETNRARCESFAQPLDEWRPSQWSNAMAGEVGEACNITKKMDRIWPANQFKQSWNKPEDQRMDVLNEKLKREIGDAVIYADLLAQRQGLTLEECVRTAFNEKSDEIHSPFKL